jgi:hypothetical protein
MTITYTWKVTGLKVKDEESLTNVVYQTYWKKIGTDEDGTVGEFSGATPFPAATVNPDNFTPFSELTEEQVLSWIQPIVTGGYEEHVNQQIQKAIDNKKNPGVDKPLPWSTDTPAPGTPGTPA